MSTAGPQPITLFCLHYLGGSGREFGQLAEELKRHGGVATTASAPPHFRIVPIDLAGFGEARASTGYAVAEMARAIAATISAEAASRWWLVGHSMGAKVATVLASQVERATLLLPGLESLVLLAGSPPSPEPMGDDKRQTMLHWFEGDTETTRAQANEYIDQNVNRPLSTALRAGAIADIERMHRAAWTAWLTAGSREDWSERVGVLRTPALLIAGSEDAGLGSDAQKRHMAPHFDDPMLEVIEGAGHLLPLEVPLEVARMMIAHESSLHE